MKLIIDGAFALRSHIYEYQ